MGSQPSVRRRAPSAAGRSRKKGRWRVLCGLWVRSIAVARSEPAQGGFAGSWVLGRKLSSTAAPENIANPGQAWQLKNPPCDLQCVLLAVKSFSLSGVRMCSTTTVSVMGRLLSLVYGTMAHCFFSILFNDSDLKPMVKLAIGMVSVRRRFVPLRDFRRAVLTQKKFLRRVH